MRPSYSGRFDVPRELSLNLSSLLKAKFPTMLMDEVATHLRIGPALAKRLLANRWTVLDRKVLERLADFVECDLQDLFTFKETRFFDPFKNGSGGLACRYVLRPDFQQFVNGRSVAYRDYHATDQLGAWFNRLNLFIETTTVPPPDCGDFKKSLSQNCIVIGSPLVNSASEMSFLTLFGLNPCGTSHRREIPFTFRVSPRSGVSSSTTIEHSANGAVGIWLRGADHLLEVPMWPPDEFRKRFIRQGRDYALIVVSNHSPNAGSIRKLIVLAGFSGMGTEAAAHALADDYLDLEPPGSGPGVVWGVIEVHYRKRAHSMDREYLGYSWRYRVGGRSPVELSTKGSAKAAAAHP